MKIPELSDEVDFITMWFICHMLVSDIIALYPTNKLYLYLSQGLHSNLLPYET